MSSRQYLVLLHLSSLAGLFFPGFGNIGAPLVLWLLRRGEDPLVDRHGRLVLDFQISWTIYFTLIIIVGTALAILLVGFLILAALLPLVITWLFYTLRGAYLAGEGREGSLPLTIRFLSTNS